jgi:hypothetical protein
MLVEADSGEDAISTVQSLITYSEVPYPSWSDWHTIGGRWEGLFQGWEAERNALCYAENPALAEDIIKEFIGYRSNDIKTNLEEATKDGVSLEDLVSQYKVEGEDFGDLDMKFYALKKLGELLSNRWTHETGVYDLDNHTANLSYFRSRLAVEPSKQYLVPVDFHF